MNRISNNSSIQRLGFVPDEDLPALYANAISLIFPSKYEGFGIPVLEARLCGTTTIASDISEIREAGGDDTVYIKPNAQNIAAAMEKVWNEPPKVISTDFLTWEESGERISRALIEISQK